MELRSWKLNFRTEIRMRTAELQVTMLWIKEVEVAKSIADTIHGDRLQGNIIFMISNCLMR